MPSKWKISMLGVLVGVAGLFVGISGTNAAFDGKKTYDGKSPVAKHCNSSGKVVSSKSFSYSGISGTVYLMYSTTCKTAWSYVKLSKALKSGYQVDGVVTRKNDGKSYHCYKTGNDVIEKGMHTCYSGMVYDYKPNKSYAKATIFKYSNQEAHGYYPVYTSKATAAY